LRKGELHLDQRFGADLRPPQLGVSSSYWSK
jgi:hypothetical protein